MRSVEGGLGLLNDKMKGGILGQVVGAGELHQSASLVIAKVFEAEHVFLRRALKIFGVGGGAPPLTLN